MIQRGLVIWSARSQSTCGGAASWLATVQCCRFANSWRTPGMVKVMLNMLVKGELSRSRIFEALRGKISRASFLRVWAFPWPVDTRPVGCLASEHQHCLYGLICCSSVTTTNQYRTLKFGVSTESRFAYYSLFTSCGNPWRQELSPHSIPRQGTQIHYLREDTYSEITACALCGPIPNLVYSPGAKMGAWKCLRVQGFMIDPDSIGILKEIKLGCHDGNLGGLFLCA